MLAPPERRAADRKRKRRQLAREKQDLHRVELWLPAIVIEGLSRQLIMDGLLTDERALDPRQFEAALTCLLTAQGKLFWAR